MEKGIVRRQCLSFSHTAAQSCPTLCDPMDCSTPGFPVLHYLLEFAQTHVQWISDAIQPCHPLTPSSPALNLSPHQSCLSVSGNQNTGASASASVIPVNFQGWYPLTLTGVISLLSRGLSQVFSSPTVWRQQFFGILCSLPFSSQNHWEDHRLNYMDLCRQSNVSAFNTLSRFVLAFLSRSKHLISRLQSPSTVILEPKKKKSVTTSSFSLMFAMK